MKKQQLQLEHSRRQLLLILLAYSHVSLVYVWIRYNLLATPILGLKESYTWKQFQYAVLSAILLALGTTFYPWSNQLLHR